MDYSAVNVNVTVDDFDSVVSYADVSVWQTPDPSSPTFNASATLWWMGTFHKTDVIDASITFNFTGPAIYVFGASGPSHGSYEIQIDGSSSIYSAYSATKSSTPHLLYGTADLTYDAHILRIKNLGAKGRDAGGNSLLFDFLQATVQLAPAGATVTNATLEETDPSLRYSGTWNHNNAPVFSGGGTSFTNQNGASVSFSFHGSAVYIFGDKKNNHGLYGIILDNGATQVFDGVSGCGGAFGKTCEQQKPTLKYFASNLDGSLHSINLENIAGVNNSFFDLDSIVVTVPSRYAPRQLSPSSLSLSGLLSSPLSSDDSYNSASIISPSSISNAIILLFCFIWLLRPSLRR